MSSGSPDKSLPRLTAIPAARSRAAVLKVRFFVLLGALLMTSGVGLFAAFSWLSYQPPTVDLTQANPRGRALAELAAEAFLAGEAMPVPGAVGVELTAGAPVELQGDPSWDGFVGFSLGGEPAERHSFLFYRPVTSEQQVTTYQLMELSVLVSIPVGGNPVLAARPQFQPASYASYEVVTDYSNFEGPALTATAQEQLEAWASAWAGDDAEQLKLITGDPAADVRYVGLGGYELESARSLATVLIGPDSYLVRVRIVLLSANGSTLDMDMDLTITEASSGLPKVIGWGPAGSGVLSPEDVRVPAG